MGLWCDWKQWPFQEKHIKTDFVSNNPDSSVHQFYQEETSEPMTKSMTLFWLFFIARDKQAPRFFLRTSHKLGKYPICCRNPLFLPLFPVIIRAFYLVVMLHLPLFSEPGQLSAAEPHYGQTESFTYGISVKLLYQLAALLILSVSCRCIHCCHQLWFKVQPDSDLTSSLQFFLLTGVQARDEAQSCITHTCLAPTEGLTSVGSPPHESSHYSPRLAVFI